MNPEELQALLAAAKAAERRGASRQEIDAIIQEETGLPHLPALITAASGGNATLTDAPPVGEREQAMQRIAAGGGSAVGDVARMAAQGLTFGLADELAGGVAALGAMVPGGRSPGEAFREVTDASRQRVEDLRTASPGGALASEVAGGLLFPAGASAKLAGKGGSLFRLLQKGRAVAPSLAETGQAAGQTFRAATQGGLKPGAGLLRDLAATGGRGAAAGAGGAGLYAFGEAEGGVGERLGEASGAAASGGLIGAGLNMLIRSPGALRGFAERRGARNTSRNPRIATRAAQEIEEAGGRTRPTEVFQISDQRKAEVQKIFKQLDESAGFTSPEIRQVMGDIRNTPLLRKAFRERGRAGFLNRALNDPDFKLDYEDMQTVRGVLQARINKAKQDGAGDLVQMFSAMRRQLDDAVEAIDPRHGPVRRAWREAVVMPEASRQGQQAASQSLDFLQHSLQEYAGQPHAQDAFRVGVVGKLLEKMEKSSGILRPTVDMQERLAVAIPDEQVRNRIMGIMAQEGRNAAMQEFINTGVKAAGFLLGGSSLLGTGLLTLGG